MFSKPDVSNALRASATVLLAQPAASAIRSYDGKQMPDWALWKVISSAWRIANALAVMAP